MTISPGDSEGGPDNRHPADQWLYVLSGQGVAIVEKRKLRISAGQLLLIEKGERHEVRAAGRTPLRTLNIYAPTVY